mmetsp:Transcript_11477/g.24061  ORF Transcript_11477/g.24061 Transcript_11477/m.24061 type:complete len:200 (-) Transcript_11477:54-653(-)
MLFTFSEVKRFASLSDAFGGGARGGGAGFDSSLGGGAGGAACSEARNESKVARLAEDSDELLESMLASSPSSSASAVLGRLIALVSSIERLLFAIDARRWSDLSFLPLIALARRFIFFLISSISDRGSSETGASFSAICFCSAFFFSLKLPELIAPRSPPNPPPAPPSSSDSSSPSFAGTAGFGGGGGGGAGWPSSCAG